MLPSTSIPSVCIDVHIRKSAHTSVSSISTTHQYQASAPHISIKHQTPRNVTFAHQTPRNVTFAHQTPRNVTFAHQTQYYNANYKQACILTSNRSKPVLQRQLVASPH
jgi:hypothetical protein